MSTFATITTFLGVSGIVGSIIIGGVLAFVSLFIPFVGLVLAGIIISITVIIVAASIGMIVIGNIPAPPPEKEGYTVSYGQRVVSYTPRSKFYVYKNYSDKKVPPYIKFTKHVPLNTLNKKTKYPVNVVNINPVDVLTKQQYMKDIDSLKSSHDAKQ